MKNIYKITNSIEKLKNNKSTLFLDPKEYNQIKRIIKKEYYNIYYPYKDSEKIILYTNKEPDITLFKINCKTKLRHQDILGSILGLNITSDYLGDIIVDENEYYFYTMSELKNFIKDNLTMIGNYKVSLEEIEVDKLKDYQRKYEEYSVIVSSLRIDNVLSKIIKTNRDKVIEKIKNDEVILNYDILNKNTYFLKENDIFSIRKYGKYKYIGISKTTKKDNIVIKYLKYI